MAIVLDRTKGKRYSILYWITIAYIIGIPNFVHFDQSGRTLNPINLTSVSLVAETTLLGYLLFIILVVDRKPIAVRNLRIDLGLWIALLIELVLATVLGPFERHDLQSATAIILPLFRLSQWVIAFALIIALYSRTSDESATELVVELIGRSSWIWIATVWLILPVMPAQVYGQDGPALIRQLGGQLIHPAHLALLASIAFFYALLFFSRRLHKWAACLTALLTIFLTAERAAQLGFVLALFLYAIVFAHKPAIRWRLIGTIALASLVGICSGSTVMEYIDRGQNAQTLASLNGRTQVWEASLEAVRMRPILGYGYSVGARNAIRDHWRFAHWIPPHAHNEFIQVTLDGGILALFLFLRIYGHVFWTSIRGLRRGPYQRFLFIVFVQFLLNSLTGGEFGYEYVGTGGILILCCVGILGGVREYRVVTTNDSFGSEMHRQGSFA